MKIERIDSTSSLVTQVSPYSGVIHTVEIPLSVDELVKLQDPDRPHIQVLFPQLTPSQREFLMTGLTDEEYAQMCGSFGSDCGEEED